jgi:GntR family galactonate operon transcriptional repressor
VSVQQSSTDGPGGAATGAWPRRPQRLATAVVDSLVDRVVSGEYPQGSVLPTESALCALFGVSRTVVREAVKSLEAMRLVVAQQGHGTTVRPLAQWDLMNPVVLAVTVRHDAELSILEDLIDVRRALEAQMAAQASLRGNEIQRAAIVAAMEHLAGSTGDPTAFQQADLAFHDAIMDASGNRLGRAAIHTINTEAYRSLRYVGDPTPRQCEISNIGHRAVTEAVLARDPDRAHRAMNDHVLGSWLRRRPPGTVLRDS